MVLKDGEETKFLKVGDLVEVQTLFGRFNMKVIDVTEKSATAMTPKETMGAWLRKDENGYWDSNSCFDPKAVARVQIV